MAVAGALLVLEIYIHHRWGVKNEPLDKDNYLNYCAVWSGSPDCIVPTAFLVYHCNNHYLDGDFHFLDSEEMRNEELG